MIFDFIEAIKDADVMSVISILLSSAILIFLCFPVHESAHAWAAYHMGDGTARSQGRISLNPTKHLDLLGTAMMLICGVGYAKPVPVTPFFFKSARALSTLSIPSLFLIGANSFSRTTSYGRHVPIS